MAYSQLIQLVIALALPWLAGVMLLVLLQALASPSTRFNWPRLLGYGYFLGFLVSGSLTWLAYSFSIRAVYPAVVTALVLLLLIAAFVLLRGYRRGKLLFGADGGADPMLRMPPALERWLVPALLVLVLLHLGLILPDVLFRPTFPWDAWTTWIYRPKIWFFTGELTPMVSAQEWLAKDGVGAYTIGAHDYPILVSLIYLWPSLSIGQWSDTLVNLPAYLAGLAIGFALYGQLRALGASGGIALLLVYVFLSIPLVATHMALGGYADIWLAGYAGLGFVALLRWLAGGDRLQLAVGLLFLLTGVLIKNEGLVWFLTALLLIVLCRSNWKLLLLAAVVPVAACFAGITLLDVPWIGKVGYADGKLFLSYLGEYSVAVYDVSSEFLSNLFLLGSWNLFWLLLAGTLFLLFLAPYNRTKLVVAIFLFLVSLVVFTIFFLTAEGEWAKQYTALNRIPLQVLPALVYAMAVIWQGRFSSRGKQVSAPVAEQP